MLSLGTRSHRAAALGLTTVALVMLSGCATTSSPTPMATAIATQAPSASPGPTEEPLSDPVESYLAWLTASRTPNVQAACAALAPTLVTRMIAELNATMPTPVNSCEEMITETAALYRAVGDDAAVDVTVESETSTDAILFVTYLSAGDCGTVAMTRRNSDWIITDQSQECAG